ncbi:phytoene desaturase family protein [Mammaliicoccus lentus]|uniref:phytoene desaturase family protein n=1 Tax=Mammaliicoccus lentus TaxID=42858 RepID=UPI001C4FE681|nr:phytoene desaturase family protein [Mammaliicoccus lentus]MBW0767261.1 phytoene desaturase [Mammaliicoccus lentus]
MNKNIVVIGGGLGGISAAIRMAQEGYTVDLYEQNNHIGGKVNRLDVEDFGFDLGPSILTMPKIFKRLFNYSNRNLEDYVTIKKLDLQIRNFFSDGTVLDFYDQIEDILKNNEMVTEKDAKELNNFMNYAKSIHDIAEKGYFNEGLDSLTSIVKYHGPFEALKKFDYFHTMQQAINKRVTNEYLREILGYFIKYVGSSSYDAPAVLTLLPQMQFEEGLWYVEGGIHKLADAMKQLAEESGVNIHLGEKVIDMHLNDSKDIESITLENGPTIYADYFISNMEVLPLYQKLLNFEQNKIDKLEKKYEPASSGYVIHLGVNKLYPQLKHHNFFFSSNSKRNYDEVFHKYQLPQDPTIYVVNPNKTDATQATNGYENIKILPHIPYIQDKPFTEAQYKAFYKLILDKLESMGLTDLRKHIVYEDIWTPNRIASTYGSHKGAIYGVVSDRKKNKGFKFPKHSKYVNNLYFVGGTVNPGAGMPMVTLSGMQVADILVQKKESSD